MLQKEYQVAVQDEQEVNLLEETFTSKRQKIHTKIYSSMTEERLRTNKLIISYSIAAPIERVFKAVAEKSAKDMHPKLNYNDLKQNTFYYSSGKNNKNPFKITELKINEVITIEFFAKDQQFIKTLKFKANKKNTKTKITFIDVVTGTTSILGWYEKHIKNVYIKRMTIAFKIQIKQAQLDLNLISKTKIEKVKNEIIKLIEYSKKLF
ncbi:hypothetical protein ESOMN_v1c05360 [Williamsoniiplasma somnilux]|uniref:Uncharacterized protein n=1 Tax=Williamsoniiplasma somnilux TaxID=215578 RepID=A0A2K8P0E8_9MOLU|nr:hypothetical protein [Williamsoniiplasma somnilux]ATZ18918.1 hypothetical protein ESOMN_v1c05360 [Williamsoniiplasma somnilux]